MCDVHVALDVVAGVAEAIHMARLMPQQGKKNEECTRVRCWRQKLEPLMSGLPLSLPPGEPERHRQQSDSRPEELGLHVRYSRAR